MSYMRKMALVPVDSNLLPAPKPKPYGRVVAALDDEINNILNDHGLDPTTKAELLQQATRRYLTYQRARPTDYPQSIQLATTSVPSVTQTSPVSNPENDEIESVEKAIYEAVPQHRSDVAKT